MTYNQIILVVYVVFCVLVSLVAFLTYGKDKKMANGSPNRIKEKTLLGITAFGGGIGAFIARLFFHHKTNKSYFSLTIYLSVLLQVLVLVALIYFAI